MAEKIRIALKRGASCVGCDIALVNLSENLLELLKIADIVFAPTLLDVKYKDLKAMPDKSITIGLYHGAVRNSENEELAHIMREKCQILIAYGACAHMGGIPGLANVASKGGIFNTVYKETFSTDNPEDIRPRTEWIDEKRHRLTLPEFFDDVKTLDDVVDVDYYVPACPPTYDMNMQILTIVKDFVEGKAPLPPKGAVIAGEKILCDECDRKKPEKVRIDRIRYITDMEPDPEKCFLEQGILCLGPVARAGCGVPCIKANMPCRGCTGPTALVMDQGGSMLSAISSILGTPDKESQLTEKETEELMAQIKDPLGYFYRFSLPKSFLKRVVRKKVGVLVRVAPYGMASAGEGFRTIIGVTGMGMETNVILIDDGVFIAKAKQNPSGIGMRKLEDAYGSLFDFGAKLYIHKESAKLRGISEEETIKGEWVDTPKLKELINSMNTIVTFV